MIKRIVKKVVATVLLCAMLTGVAYADYLGRVTYWYSDKDYVSYYPYSSLGSSKSLTYTINTEFDDTYNNSAYTQKVNNASSHASSVWGDALDFTITYTTSSAADITVYVCGEQEARMEFSGIDTYMGEYTVGVTVPFDESEYSHTVTWGTETKRVTSMRGARVFAFPDVNATQDELDNIITHEFGHALGYMGHYNNQYVLMQASTSDITEPGITDTWHIEQIYDFTYAKTDE